MKRLLSQGMLVGVLLFVSTLGVQSLLEGAGTGRASAVVSIGVDADPNGNTAITLASIDSCVSVSLGDTFSIDVFIKNVEDLRVWHVFVRYDPSVVSIADRDVEMFLAAAPGSDVRDYSYGDPSLSGAYDLLASDVADDPPHESGSGVLARLTLTAVQPGLTAVGIEDPVLWGYPLQSITVDSVANAWVAVGQDCPSEPPLSPTPTPTPVPTATPAPTPTPSPTPSLGVDVDPEGNTATSLGPIDPCLTVSVGTTFDIDVFIEGAARLRVWNVAVRHDPSVVTVVDRDVQMLLAANPGSDVVDYSYGDPSGGGTYELAAADVSEEESAHESGSGVLVRLTLKAVGPGLSPVALSGIFLFAYPVQPVEAGSVSGGQIAVERGCGPDGDLDGWPDELDNCPQAADADHTDTDADELGDACDEDDDGDGWTDVDENAIGTDMLDACTDEVGDLDAWPPDIKIDTKVDVLDVVKFRPVIMNCSSDVSYDRRYDLNTDGCINILDVVKLKPVILSQCADP